MKKGVLKNCAKFFSNYFVFFLFLVDGIDSDDDDELLQNEVRF